MRLAVVALVFAMTGLPVLPNPAAAEDIPLVREGGTYEVPVRLNDQFALNFTLDTGAADVAIPADVVSTLLRTGTVTERDFIGRTDYITADGSKLPSLRFTLRQVQVGSAVVRNVVASVTPVKGLPLLGQSFLSRLPPWQIDYPRHALVISGTGNGSAVVPAAQGSSSTTGLSDGLRYVDTRIGTGPVATPGRTVTVNYGGWISDNGAKGQQFDASKGKPFSFALGTHRVIPGWDEGIAGMKVGGTRTLFVPPILAYGTRGAGGVIPPNAALIFDVELVAVQ
jgi:clan AA aspartic protease (TIGR02281 family)